MTIRRLWVAASQHKTPMRRLAFYTTFAVGASAIISAERRFDVMFLSSPPLPGPFAVAVIAQIRSIPFVLDVRDLWPAAAQALGELSSARIIRALERAEEWLYRNSASVTATTRPFCAHIDRIAGGPKSVHLPNGALDEFLATPVVEPPSDGPFVVAYTGNFGIAQGLRIVFDAAEQLRDEDVRFFLVGDGPLAAELRSERDTRGLRSVEFLPHMQIPELARFMQRCHALLVPLGRAPLLSEFVPSKLYDAMAIGRAAIVAARGEAASLTEECGAGIVVPPEDGVALAQAVRGLMSDRRLTSSLGAAGRRAAVDHVRSRQLARLEQVLAAAASPAGGS